MTVFEKSTFGVAHAKTALLKYHIYPRDEAPANGAAEKPSLNIALHQLLWWSSSNMPFLRGGVSYICCWMKSLSALDRCLTKRAESITA